MLARITISLLILVCWAPLAHAEKLTRGALQSPTRRAFFKRLLPKTKDPKSSMGRKDVGSGTAVRQGNSDALTQSAQRLAGGAVKKPVSRRRVLKGLAALGLLLATPRVARGDWADIKRRFSDKFNELQADAKRSDAPAQKKKKKAKVSRKDPMAVVSPIDFGKNRGYIRRGFRGKHRGIDLAVGRNTPIRAATAGEVVLKRWVKGYGKTVMVLRSDGVLNVYGHLNKYGDIKVGEIVKAGQRIAYSGNTGVVRGQNGYHLHFEWRTNATRHNLNSGERIDPAPFLNGSPGYVK